MFGLVPQSFGYFVSQVYSPRFFKVQDTLGDSKFRLCWLSYLVFVFEVSCFSPVFIRTHLLLAALAFRWFFE